MDPQNVMNVTLALPCINPMLSSKCNECDLHLPVYCRCYHQNVMHVTLALACVHRSVMNVTLTLACVHRSVMHVTLALACVHRSVMNVTLTLPCVLPMLSSKCNECGSCIGVCTPDVIIKV